jgi:nitroreductase
MKEIFERRSVRKFTDQKISDENVTALIRAGMAAPSGHNDQPWHFIVIDDKKILDEITKIQPFSRPILDAQFVIIVCGDRDLKKVKEYADFWMMDCAAATQNILLAAQSLGIGSVWMGLYPIEEWASGVKKLLGLPENVIPLSLLPFGYPVEKTVPADRFIPERIHKNGW